MIEPAQPPAAGPPARCSARSTSTASSAPGPPTAGSRSRSSRSRGHAPDVFTVEAAISDGRRVRPALRCSSTSATSTGSATATSPAPRLKVGAARGARRHRPPGEAVRGHAEVRPAGGTPRSLVVLADHSMDWSLPRPGDQPAAARSTPTRCSPGRSRSPQNGGADLLYWTGPAGQRDEAIARMRRIATAQPGVLAAYDRTASQPWLRLGDRAGDVVGLVQGGVALQRPRPADLEPDPGQPRPPRDVPDPVLPGRRPPLGAAQGHLVRPRPHPGRGAHGR